MTSMELEGNIDSFGHSNLTCFEKGRALQFLLTSIMSSLLIVECLMSWQWPKANEVRMLSEKAACARKVDITIPEWILGPHCLMVTKCFRYIQFHKLGQLSVLEQCQSMNYREKKNLRNAEPHWGESGNFFIKDIGKPLVFSSLI